MKSLFVFFVNILRLPIDIALLSFEALMLTVWRINSLLQWFSANDVPPYRPKTWHEWGILEGKSFWFCPSPKLYGNPFLIKLLVKNLKGTRKRTSKIKPISGREQLIFNISWARLMIVNLFFVTIFITSAGIGFMAIAKSSGKGGDLATAWKRLANRNRVKNSITNPNPKNSAEDTVKIKTEEAEELIKQAKISLQNNMNQTALNLYKRALEADAANVEAYMGLGELYLKDNLIDNAYKSFKNALERDVNNIEACIKLAKISNDSSNYDRLKEYAIKAISINDKDARGYSYLASYLLKYNQLTDSLKNANKALEIDENNMAAILVKANILVRQQKISDLDTAEKLFSKVLNLDSENVDAQLGLGRIYSQRDNTTQALSHYEKVAKENPNHILANETLARIYVSLRRDDDAIKLLIDFTEKVKQAYNSRILLAKIYLRKKDVDESYLITQEVINDDNSNIQAHMLMSQIYLNCGLTSKGMIECKIAKSFAPNSIVVLKLYAQLLNNSKKYAEATTIYQRILNYTNGEDLDSRIKLGNCYELQEKYSIAISHYETAVEKYPNNPLAFLHLASLYSVQKDYKRAISNYSRAIELNPQNKIALNNIANIMLYKSDATNYPSALSYAKQAFEIDPYNVTIMDTLGWAYYRNGNIAKATELITKAYKQARARADINFHYAVMLYEKQDYKRAHDILKQVLAFSTDFMGADFASEINFKCLKKLKKQTPQQ